MLSTHGLLYMYKTSVYTQMQPISVAAIVKRLTASVQKKAELSLKVGGLKLKKAMRRYTVRNTDKIWCQCCCRFWKEEETELPLDLGCNVCGGLKA